MPLGARWEVIITKPIVLECENIHHWFGQGDDAVYVLHDFQLKIIHGEFVGIVGPSGCGKSTLLRAIVGTHPPRKGHVKVFSKEFPNGRIADRPGRDRGIVYQRYSLFPFYTALENVAVGLMLNETSLPYRFAGALGLNGWRKMRRDHLQQAEALLVKVGLQQAIHRYPYELSGGMCQRVAIAQALIMKPKLLLLDEPFGALDEATREELQRMLLLLYSENLEAKQKNEEPPWSILLVTHELNEAIFVCDRIIGMSQFWDWKAHGHENCPGATKVYDKMAPVFKPDVERRYEQFAEQREEIRRVVFDPEVLQPRDEHVTFWRDLDAGMGEGMLKT